MQCLFKIQKLQFLSTNVSFNSLSLPLKQTFILLHKEKSIEEEDVVWY